MAFLLEFMQYLDCIGRLYANMTSHKMNIFTITVMSMTLCHVWLISLGHHNNMTYISPWILEIVTWYTSEAFIIWTLYELYHCMSCPNIQLIECHCNRWNINLSHLNSIELDAALNYCFNIFVVCSYFLYYLC